LAAHDVQEHANASLTVEALKHAKFTRERTRDDLHGLAEVQIAA
jgi:hypothetical protein